MSVIHYVSHLWLDRGHISGTDPSDREGALVQAAKECWAYLVACALDIVEDPLSPWAMTPMYWNFVWTHSHIMKTWTSVFMYELQGYKVQWLHNRQAVGMDEQGNKMKSDSIHTWTSPGWFHVGSFQVLSSESTIPKMVPQLSHALPRWNWHTISNCFWFFLRPSETQKHWKHWEEQLLYLFNF